ncbi:SRPBCC family protein [Pseudoalteromonas phenolica]|uniref:SRPBCC family protein n=1 Tax=Pseudoalteromonas phenolica TaxID=161398 RepID=A0A5R9Q2R9_9GAMM|nr:SRPBCC family protein [Pseudoalteromonas phenolica]TLX47463.1 SRPBCC family protein [Pseudoalteromonas phenolica]
MLVVEYQKQIACSADTLLNALLDHSNLDRFFNAKFKVLKPADKDEITGGKGCIRQVSILYVNFEEQITKADQTGICYQVLNDFPVRQHRGKIHFHKIGEHTQVSYRIQCQSPWYIPKFALKAILQKDIEQCLNRLGDIYASR